MEDADDSWKIKVQIDPKAAYTFGSCKTSWEKMTAADNPDDPFFPFHSAEEFEIIEFLAASGLSQASINRFLKLLFVSEWYAGLNMNTHGNPRSRC